MQALVCYNVCCLGEWVAKIGPDKLNNEVIGKNRRMELFRGALNDLADHFRLPLDMSETPDTKQERDKAVPGKIHINLNQC